MKFLRACSIFVFPVLLAAQPGPGQEDRAIAAADHEQVIQKLAEALEKRYVFPGVGVKLAADLKQRLNSKEYEAVTSARQFADILTEQLQEISRDKHLRVRYSFDPIPERTGPSGPPPPEEIERMRRQAGRSNFGFQRVEILEGNVGYLDLRGFMNAALGGETAVAAMNFLANSDALIVDLRSNGGGDPAMVALLSSFLFDNVVHLNDLYFRPADSTHQWWTLPYVPGKRLAGKPVYVLTSKRTFSAAEEFTYNLKNLKRATIVGETTGGGAHPGEGARLHPHFGAFISTGRAINPVSKTNWEGTGVEPDVKTGQEMALKKAHLLAVKEIGKAENNPALKKRLEDAARTLEKELSTP